MIHDSIIWVDPGNLMEDGETAATFLEKTDIEKLFILSDGRYAVTDMYNRAIRIADEKPELLSSPYYTD